jgi:hypothetical protein
MFQTIRRLIQQTFGTITTIAWLAHLYHENEEAT